eukprot:351691-Chlamydomonas_euryale.AAC.9
MRGPAATGDATSLSDHWYMHDLHVVRASSRPVFGHPGKPLGDYPRFPFAAGSHFAGRRPGVFPTFPLCHWIAFRG